MALTLLVVTSPDPSYRKPNGAKQAAAFFDLDKTVIAKASLMAFSRQFYREGLLNRRNMASGLWAQLLFLRFGANATRLERMRQRVMHVTAGWEQDRVRRIVTDALSQVIGPITYKEAVKLIKEHQAEGRRVYIVSAAPAEIVEPLARHLGVEEAIASTAAVSSGRYTGQMEDYTFGPRKAEAMRLVALRDGLDLSASWAYSDSATDVPMLEVVGHPVAVNPDRALRRIAQMRGWPVLKFSEPMVVTPQGGHPWRAGLAVTGGTGLAAVVVLAVALVARSRQRTRALPS
ncbi:MAG: HAD family hydrolase [Acidimicrobiales bacterium]